jgi:transposase-like protein
VSTTKQKFENFMLYVGGDKLSWRCPGPIRETCGANVFHKVAPASDGCARYECNGCGTVWRGEQGADDVQLPQ